MGIAYLFIGIFDLMHVFTFGDIGIFEAGINQSSQFWVTARLMESLTLLIVIAFPTLYLRINHRIIYLGYSVISIIMIYLILSGNLLPDLYVVGGGQTAIKYILEYSIIIIFSLATMYVLNQIYQNIINLF